MNVDEFDPNTMDINNLSKKLRECAQISRKIPTLCVWSDLLNFGKPLLESNWLPSDDEWVKIAQRLKNMQGIFASNLEPTFENALVSNDAIIRNFNCERGIHPDYISMWFRAIIWTHQQVNTCENLYGYPGMRTIVSGGVRLVHNFSTITFEDFVYNYSKPNPNGLSTITQRYGDRPILYHHDFLQMNTAFAKSFTIDAKGKLPPPKNRIFFDESAITTLKELASSWGILPQYILDTEKDDYRGLYVINSESEWYHFGFEFDKNPIVLTKDKVGFDTKVYSLKRFYPWDESPAEFVIDVDSEMSSDCGTNCL